MANCALDFRYFIQSLERGAYITFWMSGFFVSGMSRVREQPGETPPSAPEPDKVRVWRHIFWWSLGLPRSECRSRTDTRSLEGSSSTIKQTGSEATSLCKWLSAEPDKRRSVGEDSGTRGLREPLLDGFLSMYEPHRGDYIEENTTTGILYTV